MAQTGGSVFAKISDMSSSFMWSWTIIMQMLMPNCWINSFDTAGLFWPKQGSSSINFRDAGLLIISSPVQFHRLTEKCGWETHWFSFPSLTVLLTPTYYNTAGRWPVCELYRAASRCAWTERDDMRGWQENVPPWVSRRRSYGFCQVSKK